MFRVLVTKLAFVITFAFIITLPLAESSPIVLAEGPLQNNSKEPAKKQICFIKFASPVSDGSFDEGLGARYEENGLIDSDFLQSISGDERKLAIAKLQCFLSKLNRHMLLIGRSRFG